LIKFPSEALSNDTSEMLHQTEDSFAITFCKPSPDRDALPKHLQFYGTTVLGKVTTLFLIKDNPLQKSEITSDH